MCPSAGGWLFEWQMADGHSGSDGGWQRTNRELLQASAFNGAGVLHSQFSSHDQRKSALRARVNTKIPGPDPFARLAFGCCGVQPRVGVCSLLHSRSFGQDARKTGRLEACPTRVAFAVNSAVKASSASHRLLSGGPAPARNTPASNRFPAYHPAETARFRGLRVFPAVARCAITPPLANGWGHPYCLRERTA